MSAFTEKYELKRVAFVLDNLDDFLPKQTHEETKKMTKKFLEKIMIGEGEIRVSYNYSKFTNYGRKYSYGIQSIKRNIRDFLLTGKGIWDYDLRSAHPCILYHLCKKHKIHSDENLLKDYVMNKQKVIDTHFQEEIYKGVDVKKLILTATNSDDMLMTKNEWLINYQNEMAFIRDELKGCKDYKKILQDTDKIKQDNMNMNSSFVNRILCKVEGEIIDKFVKFIRSQDKEVFSLMFDGIMVYGGDDELLDNLNCLVKQFYGDYFEVTNKNILSNVKMGEYEYDKEKMLGDIDSIETRMGLFVNKFQPIKIINPALYGIIQEDKSYEFYKKDAFIQSVEHIRYTNEKGDSMSVVSKWLTDYITDENTFSHVITDPTYEKKDKYNLWSKWDILNWDGEWSDDMKAVEYMKKHILVLCNYDEDVANAMELWISHLLKYPKSKSFVPIFIGKQGAGKDMFFAWIEMMIGAKKKFETSTPEKHIWGSFNPFMKSAYLIHLSEFGRKNTQDYTGQIKAIATTGKICINEKNKGEYEIDSYHRFVGASNFAEPIPIESDNRRYLLIHTSPDKIGDTEYFEEGWGFLKDKNAIKSMFEYFMALDPPENFKYHMIKESEYMKYLKDVSRPQEECWLEYYVSNNSQKGVIQKTKTLELYENYLTWCGLTRQSYKMEKRKFLILFKVAIGNNTKHIHITKSNGVMIGVFNWDAIKEEGKISDLISNEFNGEEV